MAISERPRRVFCRHEELSSPLLARRAWGTRPRFRSGFGGREGRIGRVRSAPNTGCAFAVGRDIGENRKQAFARTLGRVFAQGSYACGVADLATDLYIRQQPQTPVGEGRGIVCDDNFRSVLK